MRVNIEQKIVGENFVYDEKGSQEWEQDTRKKLEEIIEENIKVDW